MIAIRAALETALDGMSPSLSTAWENVAFNPPAPGAPYQNAFMILVEPENLTIGDGVHQESGLLQVNLVYPANAGTSPAALRAQLMRATFYRGASFVSGGVTTIVQRTPEIGNGKTDGDRWVLPVKIRFFAYVN